MLLLTIKIKDKAFLVIFVHSLKLHYSGYIAGKRVTLRY